MIGPSGPRTAAAGRQEGNDAMTVPAPRTSPLAGLGVTTPVLAAPMAGGATTAALVTAADVLRALTSAS